MRKLLLTVTILCIFSLTGCMKQYKLTDMQTDAVSEYMAGLLLKYDKNYEEVPDNVLNRAKDIIYGTDAEISDEDIKDNEEDSLADSAFENDIEGDNTSQDGNSIIKDNGSISTENSTGKASDENVQDNSLSITDVFGAEDFEVKYLGYHMYETYPEEASYFTLTPKDGYQFMIVSILVRNKTEDEKLFDLTNVDVDYQLDIQLGNSYKSQVTLLENDIHMMNASVGAGKELTALLVFEIPKDIDMSESNLIIENDGKSVIVTIK